MIDLGNIKAALDHVHCKGQVHLAGINSATRLIRHLVCTCLRILYEPRKDRCVSLYRTKIIEPLVQRDIPLIIKAIPKIAANCPCEGIQIYVDNISNVFSSCIAGALQFQGDDANVSSNQNHLNQNSSFYHVQFPG